MPGFYNSLGFSQFRSELCCSLKYCRELNLNHIACGYRESYNDIQKTRKTEDAMRELVRAMKIFIWSVVLTSLLSSER